MSYVVKRGDSLTTIAKRFRVAVSSVVRANHLANPDRLVAGDTLRIPREQTFSLAITPTAGPQGQRFSFTLTHANPFENIVFAVRSPKATFNGPPHQASSEGAATATYRTGKSDAVGTYTVTAHGDKGTDVNATFVLTAATTTTA